MTHHRSAPTAPTVVGWPIEVQTLGTLTVTLRVKSDKAADAVRLSVPIGPLAVPEVASIIGNTTSSAEHTIELPANTIKEISTLQIDLSPSIAASILDGLAYLTGYPYGCVEQTMSKALPNAVVGRAFNALGVDNPHIKADLPRKVNAGLQRLYGYQHNDGGWGWWFDDSTDDYQTAYVLFGLAMTKQAGYEVDAGVIERGAKYLTERLPNIDDERTKAYALFALALNGKGQSGRNSADGGASRIHSGWTCSRKPGLAIALHELGDEALAQKMLDRLIEQAVVTDSEAYWNTGDADGHYQREDDVVVHAQHGAGAGCDRPHSPRRSDRDEDRALADGASRARWLGHDARDGVYRRGADRLSARQRRTQQRLDVSRVRQRSTGAAGHAERQADSADHPHPGDAAARRRESHPPRARSIRRAAVLQDHAARLDRRINRSGGGADRGDAHLSRSQIEQADHERCSPAM